MVNCKIITLSATDEYNLVIKGARFKGKIIN